MVGLIPSSLRTLMENFFDYIRNMTYADTTLAIFPEWLA